MKQPYDGFASVQNAASAAMLGRANYAENSIVNETAQRSPFVEIDAAVAMLPEVTRRLTLLVDELVGPAPQTDGSVAPVPSGHINQLASTASLIEALARMMHADLDRLQKVLP